MSEKPTPENLWAFFYTKVGQYLDPNDPFMTELRRLTDAESERQKAASQRVPIQLTTHGKTNVRVTGPWPKIDSVIVQVWNETRGIEIYVRPQGAVEVTGRGKAEFYTTSREPGPLTVEEVIQALAGNMVELTIKGGAK